MAKERAPRPPRRDRTTHLGEWLTAARERKGLRQNQVAAYLDVNQGRITEWEQGKRVPAPEILEKLSDLFEETPPAA